MVATWWKSLRRRLGHPYNDGPATDSRRERFRPGLEELEARQVPAFVPGATLLTELQPVGVAAADFNGDGKRDFVVTCLGQGTVNVFLGNGDGSFQVPKTLRVGLPCGAVAVGVSDGDGNRDLVVANPFFGVSVLFGHGDGTFDAPLAFPTGLNVISVVVADFNGDHQDDFAVAITAAQGVKVFLNTGGHTFSAASYGVLDVPSGVAAGDFNNDNK